MVATSARRRSKSYQNAGNSNRGRNNLVLAVGHDCSMNGSEVGSWAAMECYEGSEEENEGLMCGQLDGS